MKLIKPSFKIIPQERGLSGVFKQIEIAARNCYKSEDKIGEDTAEKMVKFLNERTHYAMLEHGTVYLYFGPETAITGYKYRDNAYSKYVEIREKEKPVPLLHKYITTNYRVLVENGWLDDLQYLCAPTKYHEKRITVRFVCDRGVSHEYVRHRVFSFAQESTRYCNYSQNKFAKEITYIIPCWSELKELSWEFQFNKKCICNGLSGIDISKFEENIDNYDELSNKTYNSGEFIWIISLLESESRYFDLINRLNWSPQQARAVLPNSLKTELIMTGFVSDWEHFFYLRDAKDAHPQAYELAHPLHEEFKKLNLL